MAAINWMNAMMTNSLTVRLTPSALTLLVGCEARRPLVTCSATPRPADAVLQANYPAARRGLAAMSRDVRFTQRPLRRW